jgi:hypothetical protein
VVEKRTHEMTTASTGRRGLFFGLCVG